MLKYKVYKEQLLCLSADRGKNAGFFCLNNLSLLYLYFL